MPKRLLILLLCAACWGCATSRPRPASTIRLKGSDTMIILAHRWAEEYMQQHPGMAMYAEGGGTATGVEALIKGDIDICTASRPIHSGEARRLVERQGYLGISYLVARDALSIYVNPNNQVRDLTLAQISDLFTGKITNWRALGGRDAEIVLVSRSPNSGTYLYFQEHVLEGQSYSSTARFLTSTEAIVRAVAEDARAIGYGGLAYGKNIVHCNVNGVAPTPANVRAGTYPIARYLYFYTMKEPSGAIKAFIDWVLSRDGQSVVEQTGYIPLMEMRR